MTSPEPLVQSQPRKKLKTVARLIGITYLFHIILHISNLILRVSISTSNMDDSSMNVEKDANKYLLCFLEANTFKC